MSANRIVKRRAFAASRPNGHSYHEYAIANGDRRESFQSIVRTARREFGVAETSTNMHRFYGRSY